METQFGFTHETVGNTDLNAEKTGFNSLRASDHFFLDDNSEDCHCMEA
ncbi:MAG: hypothetical protein ACFFD4_02625 [Candidatus Odinarchaeota archaeon]